MDKGKICKIRDISRAISELDTKCVNEFGVCINEAMLLCTLLEKEQTTASRIAEELGITQSNASKLIRVVEEKGFVERTLGKDDRRKMFFALTNEGKFKIEAMKCCDMSLPSVLEKALE